MTAHWAPDVAAPGPHTVLCAVLGRSEGEVVSVLAASPECVVTRRCVDLAELLAAAAAGLGQVAVVSGHLPGLDRTVISALRRDGTRVIAVLDEGSGLLDTSPDDRLAAIGCAAQIAAANVPTELVQAVLTLARQPAVDSREPAPGGVPGGYPAVVGGPGKNHQIAPVTLPGPDPRLPRQVAAERPVLVAVWGPTGAPGRSTIATNLAAELVTPAVLRRRGRRREGARARQSLGPVETALLVDADTYSGVLAQTMGMLDESSGLATACRAAAHGALPVAALAAMTPLVAPNLRILTGIARASRWPEVTESALEVLWETARLLAKWTVVDCGFSIERDELLTYDTRAPQRNGATLSALAAADIIVVVGGSDAVSVQRLVRALDELQESGLVAGRQRLVVVNRVRASAIGPRPSNALRDALRRYSSVPDPVLVPDDQQVIDAALLSGRTLAEAAPVSAVRRAIRDLAARVRELAAAPVGLDLASTVQASSGQAVPFPTQRR